MKKTTIYFILISIILLGITLSCQKEDIETPLVKTSVQDTISLDVRSGSADAIFYLGSLTTDNYLNEQVDKKRIYKIFNKIKVRQIRFNATTKPYIVVNGLSMRHYNVEVLFNDGTSHTFTAYTKSGPTTFTFVPSGVNTLSDSHSAKFMQIESTGVMQNSSVYNFWRDSYIVPSVWTIKKDNINTLSTRILDPLDRSSTLFRPNHVHI